MNQGFWGTAATLWMANGLAHLVIFVLFLSGDKVPWKANSKKRVMALVRLFLLASGIILCGISVAGNIAG